MLEFIEKPGFVIVLLVALVVFGSKRLPDSARSLGRSMRILKAEAKGLKDDGSPTVVPTPTPAPTASAAPVITPVPAVLPPAPPAAMPPVGEPVGEQVEHRT